MTTLHAREAARVRAEIVELGELRVLARSRAPGLAQFLRTFLLHLFVDGDCCGRWPPCKVARPRCSRYLRLHPVRLFSQCARRAHACDLG